MFERTSVATVKNVYSLEDVCNINYGTRVVERLDKGVGYTVYGGGGATFTVDHYNREDCVVVSRFGMSPQCTRFVAGKFYLNDSGLTLTPKLDGVRQRFLDYQILGCTGRIYALGKGSAQKNLDVPAFRALQLFVPSTAEQQRIVKLLDSAVALLTITERNAKQNLLNARRLFANEHDAVLQRAEAKWSPMALGEAYDVRDGTHDSPKYYDYGFPLVTSKNLKRTGLTMSGAKLIAEKDYVAINKRSAVHKGDVLFAMIGTIGNPVIVEVEPNFAIKNVALFKMCHGNDNRFLRYVLSAPYILKRMLIESKGTTQKFVGLGYLRKFMIPMPPVDDQKLIADKLDRIAAVVGRLEDVYAEKLVAISRLKESMFCAAFTDRT